MASPLFTFFRFLSHWLTAKNAHGLHSPFLFSLYGEVISKKDPVLLKQLKKLRKELCRDRELVRFQDPRSGTWMTSSQQALIRRSASSSVFSAFLIHLIDYLGCRRVVETGTSTGLNSLCLEHSRAEHVFTLEGAPEIAQLASRNFAKWSTGKVHLKTGKLREVFKDLLSEAKPDFVFLDADHRQEAVLFCLDELQHVPSIQCIVIHDIYWSDDMHKAWQSIIADSRYPLTIDIFQAGLLFPHFAGEKQHFKIRF